jgi:DNA-binding NarL/FixJ family response regulator
MTQAQKGDMPIRVSIVEDKGELRAAYARLLDQAGGLECVSRYSNAEEALKNLAQDNPDVTLMDINLPGMNGIECVRQLKVQAPKVQIIMLTIFEDADRIFESLKAGASGYLLKRSAGTEIVDAVRQVHAGAAPMSGSVARKVVQYFNQFQPKPELHDLTHREREVLQSLSEGMLYKEIGEALEISIHTVHKHLKSIYDKLHVTSRTDATRKYLGH